MEIAFISGKITGDDNYKESFAKKQKELELLGYKVINPCEIVPEDIEYSQQLLICLKLIKLADVVYFKDNWINSNGSKIEREFAKSLNKKIIGETPTDLSKEVFKPKYRNTYYAVFNDTYDKQWCVDSTYWYNTTLDLSNYAVGNCFKTREEAKQNFKKIKNKLEKYMVEE